MRANNSCNHVHSSAAGVCPCGCTHGHVHSGAAVSSPDMPMTHSRDRSSDEHEHGPGDEEDGCSGSGHSHSHGHNHGAACSCGHDHGHEEDGASCSCGCGCGHDHGAASEGDQKKTMALLVSSALLLLFGLFLPNLNETVRLALYGASYLLCGSPILFSAVKNILKGRVFDENFLMAVASVGAFLIGSQAEGVAVMLLYRLGEAMEDRAVGRSRRSIKALMDIRPDKATLLRDDGTQVEVSPADVRVGQRILVLPGERAPLDGTLLGDAASLDTSALTGESAPQSKETGDAVLSGSIPLDRPLTMLVTAPFEESTVSRILKMTEDAAAGKAAPVKFITRFARKYTPAVCIAALMLAVVPPLVGAGAWPVWIYRALSFLVISCPCALVLSVPLCYFAAIGAASRRGILLKNGAAIEEIAKLHTVAFDKTGTLTEGRFGVTRALPAEGYTESELLNLAAGAEAPSNHPIARALRAAARVAEGAPLAGDYEQINGKGIRWTRDGTEVLCGSPAWFAEQGIGTPSIPEEGTAVCVAVNGAYAGVLCLSDPLRPGVKEALSSLKKAGVVRVALLTGDRRETADAVGAALSIDDVRAGLLPGDKAGAMGALKENLPAGRTAAFLGDGINDAPVLAMADVGFAMGGIGQDAAIEAADAVIMTDDPGKIAEAVSLSKKTRRIVRQNIVFALGVKGALLILGAAGITSLWLAVFADVGVCLLAVLNALRLTRAAK